jgi:serine/threonine protein kinase/Tol biopolymer transport system component
MPLAAGSRLGSYEILSALGAGGMGEVYRATDTVLKRQVALKVLPPEVANDPERVARFQREAEVLASLNHPNIAHLYGLERSGGTLALVMELVEGPTLADRIAQGAIPVDEVLRIAKQIAEALEAAHEQGIIHRDLKPANIKVRDDGAVKVLDFGLAKAMEPAGSSGVSAAAVTNSPTITSPALMTGIGMLLGTAAYMSPEQAKGRPADKRSDIWAFGCVVYEMLTGTRAFEAEEVSETLAFVLTRAPDWTKLPSDVPNGIRTLLRRSLEKDRRKRLADIADARIEIEDTQLGAADHVQSAAQTRSRLIVLLATGCVVAAILVAVAIIAVIRQPSVATKVIRFDIAVPSDWTPVLPDSLGPSAGTSLAISPDGQHVVFGATNSQGRVALWLRSLDRVVARELTDTDGASGPFWSADSRFVGFYAAGKLKTVEISSGTVKTLCEIPTFNGATWNREGIIVLARAGGGQGGPLLRVSEDGGTPTAATELHQGEILHTRPAFLPDGRHFLYRTTEAVSNGAIYVGALDSAERKLVFENTSTGRVIYASGHLLYMQGTTLVAQPFDPNNLVVVGPPTPIAEDVQTTGPVPPVGVFSASDSGVLVYRTGRGEVGSQLTWLDRSGKVVTTLGARGDYTDLELSPNGERASISVRDAPPQQKRHIWVIDTVRGLPIRLTTGSADESTSIWSPDGNRIVFNSNRQGAFDLYEKAAAGMGNESPLFPREPNQAVDRVPLSWSQDGNAVLFEVSSRFDRAAVGGSPYAVDELWIVRLTGDRKPGPYLRMPTAVAQGRFSPNGHWIAYTSAEVGAPQVYVTSFPEPTLKRRISPEGGTYPRWGPDGRELFFLNRNAVWVANITAKDGTFDVGTVQPLFTVRVSGPWSNYAVAPDGQRFLVNMQPASQTGGTAMTVALNWTDELKRPVKGR